MRFEVQLALRHLRSGGWQTVLIAAGVAMAVTLVIFVSGLIYGVQERWLAILTGSIAHVQVSAPEPAPRALSEVVPPVEGRVAVSRVEQRAQQRQEIEQWRVVVRELASFPRVRAVSAAVAGDGTLTRGEKVIGVRVFGAEPDQQDRIVGLSGDLLSGTYLGIGTEDAVIGYRLAEEMGLALGDRARITSSRGIAQTFRVAGIFDTGQETIDASWVFVTLRAAQSLFASGSAVTHLSLSLDDLFAANAVADQIQASLGLEAKSWMRDNPQALSGLRAQSATALLISGFSLLAAGFAIASVLIVSVLKRSREIGILKAMGARQHQILKVFTLEGLGVALVGAAMGALGGSGLILLARLVPQASVRPGQLPEPLLPGVIRWQTILGTAAAMIAITVLASVFPARRAARLDPVEVIRGG
ncbi:MAG: ABC transporter permease [Armatimonadetes bacterium]|jgi:lipoprotein-releasing system permease protein|nr:ABC transporter permease [Armatimonadota bacterium]